jgi:dienelactone hydrolase
MPELYSPSLYHEEALRKLKPSLTYTGQPLDRWRAQLGRAFRDLFGWDLKRERVPLNVRELEREETETYTRRKLVFTSEPGAEVPCHLLVPKLVHLPAPAFICLQGHTSGMHISLGKPKDEHDAEEIKGDRDFALQAVANGYVALAIEQRAFGERQETVQAKRVKDGCQDAAMHALLLGRPLASERAWDVSRAIDLLETLPEVRKDRFGCMGNSGGGTVTYYSACVEPRIWLAMPSCSFCAYADSIFRIGHCTDNYLPGILKHCEMGDLASLIAPRKLVVVAGRTDGIFPIEGVQREFDKVKRIFAAAGKPENARLVIGEGGHRFYAKQGWAAVREMMG